ncbi:hypothetical protein FHS43_002115 [Streptosporangium becharense]|uniref:Uncharacterized protein n=1 Tax=Streptosporangium becharense TaxID=1816182 RepID=A0A7W9IB88_9ACTN|nr:hypothetical protein [Streptosporangium becharense]MBB2910852.1 hypothetical protein [Streptosporangium becharense]MBB5817547.1 hypothetical protein [Streptosporangium becharense]
MSHRTAPKGATPPPAKPPLLTLRTLVILFAAVGVGILIGVLSYMGGVLAPLAVVAGLSAAGAAVVGLHAFLD